MASSQIHYRSISLPSRLHPINSTEFEAELEKLKSNSTSVSLTSDSIQSGLLKLAELYTSVDELTQSSSTQRSINASSIQSSLEGSIELLDSCSSIKELVQMIKESVQALQSALRRKGSDSSIQNDVAAYLSSRKKANKCIKTSLKTLKNFEARVNASNVSLNGDEERFPRALREVYCLNVSIFKSCLLLFSSPAVKSGSWNLVSRLLLNKSGDLKIVNEVGCVDSALSNLQGSLRNGGVKVVDREMVQKSLQNLDYCVEGVEVGLEAMFRQLVQSRVNLLNIVTNC